jgi:uncharacterized secreted protein with C-terminal beta-propeller domain
MARTRPIRTFRPMVELLEDRYAPAIIANPIAIDPIVPLPILGLPPIFISPGGSATTSVVAPTTFGSESAFVQYLTNDAINRYQYLFGRSVYWWGGWEFPLRELEPGIMLSANMNDAAVSVAGPTTNFSQTNDQVAGVDEGDLVKTDGSYLYVISGQQLIILQALPANQMQVVSRMQLDGEGSALYLDGSRVTVLSSMWPAFGPDGDRYRGDSPVTAVTVYDVSDPTAPRVVQDTYAEGNVQSSRDVGGVVYVVLENDTVYLPPPITLNDNGTWVYETQDQYLARIAGHEIDLAMPQFLTRPSGPNSGLQAAGPLTDPANVYQPRTGSDTSLITLLAFDVTSDTSGPASRASAFAGYGATIYATADHLYVVNQEWDSQASIIYQFDLNGDQVSLGAAGVVPGRVLNQFSLDEQGGYLRVATTVGWESGVSNGIYVLAPQNGVLTVVGSLEGLAPAEQIRAVYFMGDRCYLVTSHYIDPLFVIDLSNPTAPAVLGQLQMPGYSTYIQPLDATHLLGIGRDGDDGLKMALFDVSDPTAPQLIDEYDFPSAGWNWGWMTSSDAEYNSHAFSYFPDSGTLALPVSTTTWMPIFWDPVPFERIETLDVAAPVLIDPVSPVLIEPWYPVLPLFSETWSLDVFHLDMSTGFQYLGRIDQDSPVERSVRIGDTLYSVADNSVRAEPLDDPTAPGTEVWLQGAPTSVQGILGTAVAGGEYDGEVVEFTASNPSQMSVSIDWGDGQTATGNVTDLGNGRFAVSAPHTYGSVGQFEYTVHITFESDDGSWGSGSYSGWVNVLATPPPVDPTPQSTPALAGPGDDTQPPAPAPAPVTPAPAAPVSADAPLVEALSTPTLPPPAPGGTAPVATDAPVTSPAEPPPAQGDVSLYDSLAGAGSGTAAASSSPVGSGAVSGAVADFPTRPDDVAG